MYAEEGRYGTLNYALMPPGDQRSWVSSLESCGSFVRSRKLGNMKSIVYPAGLLYPESVG